MKPEGGSVVESFEISKISGIYVVTRHVSFVNKNQTDIDIHFELRQQSQISTKANKIYENQSYFIQWYKNGKSNIRKIAIKYDLHVI